MKRRIGTDAPEIVLHTVLTNKNYRQLSDIIRLAKAMGASRVDFDALIAYRPEQKVLELNEEQKKKLN